MGAAAIDRAAREYLATGSLYRAAITAGLATTTNAVQQRVATLRGPILQRAAELRREEAKAWAAERAEIVSALHDIATADAGPILAGDPPDTWPPALRRAVQSVRLDASGRVVSVTLADRVAAARALAQAQGWIAPDVHVTAIVGLGDRLAAARERLRSSQISAQMPADDTGSRQIAADDVIDVDSAPARDDAGGDTGVDTGVDAARADPDHPSG